MPTLAMIDATEAKNRFGEVIRRAYQGREHLIVRRDGIPVVVVVPIADYERMVNTTLPESESVTIAAATDDAARTKLLNFLQRAHAQMPHVPDQEVETDIAAALQAIRAAA